MAATATKEKLNIGGDTRREGWKNVNIQALDSVDYVCDAVNLPMESGSVSEIYASHVLEHFTYQGNAVLKEWFRVLEPGGLLRVAVPNLPKLCSFYLRTEANDRHHVMRIMFGGQLDEWDFHYAGYDFETLRLKLGAAGFRDIRQVDSFGLFRDCSEVTINGENISLNIEAIK